ncbi:ankyrin repeat domain-containing protein [Actinoplanes sp. CA-054009]
MGQQKEPEVITAARGGDLAALSRLAGAVDARGWMGETALHAAAAAGSAEAVRMLLGAGAQPRARRDNGDTPLHRAATGDIAELLIRAAREVTPDQHNEHGQTPLHCARDREVTEVLLRRGASLSARDHFGRTPLHDAGAGKARALLDAGAQVDARDRFGETPLHRAVRDGDTELVELLLAEGADPAVRDEHGRSPIHLARQRGMTGLATSNASLAHTEDAQSALRPGRDENIAFTVARHATLIRWRLTPAPRPEIVVPTDHIAFRDLAVHPQRPLIAVAPAEAPVELRADDLSGPEPLDGLDDATALAFSPDGRLLAAAVDPERVVLYDLATRRITATADAGERTHSVAFSPDGAFLATACSFQAGAHVRLDRVTPTGGLDPVTEIESPGGDEIPAAVFTPDGRHLLIWSTSDTGAAHRTPGWRGTLTLTTLNGHPIWHRTIDATTTRVRTPRLGWRTTPAITPNGETVALGLDGTLVLFAAADGRTLAVLPVDGHCRAVAAPGPHRLVIATDQGLRVPS